MATDTASSGAICPAYYTVVALNRPHETRGVDESKKREPLQILIPDHFFKTVGNFVAEDLVKEMSSMYE